MQDWMIVGIIAIVVLFGASKLPQIARNVGKAQGEFKKGIKEGVVEETAAPAAPAAAPPAEPPAAESPSGTAG